MDNDNAKELISENNKWLDLAMKRSPNTNTMVM